MQLKVKIFEIIRKRLGLTEYAMAKAMGKPQNSYNYLEQRAAGHKPKDIIKLQELSGLEDAEFWKLYKKHS